MAIEIRPSERIAKLPPYLFKEIDRLRDEVKAKGVDVIDLGVGDPDLPTPHHIVEKLKEAASDPRNHRYPSYSGMEDFRFSVAKWYKRRFNVELDPLGEVVSLIGSKEGIAHFPLAFINPGDVALITSPCYPVYHIGNMFAGGESYFLPLVKENDFLPNLDEIPSDILKKAKILFINYPNNPTSQVAERDFFEKVIDWGIEHNIIIAHDAAYTELSYDGFKPMSILEIPGAKDIAIEFHSLSKTYNMTGWRIGFAVGNSKLVQGLGKVKSNIDSGIFQAIQVAGIAALESDPGVVEDIVKIYKERRDVMVEGLKEIGLELITPKATFYLWVSVPQGYTSASFTSHLLEQAGIVTTPGNGFGDPGEGYIRIALTVGKDRLEEAVARIEKAGL